MYETGFELKQVPEIPTRVQQNARQATLDHNQERMLQRQALTRQVKQQRSEYLKKLNSIIGIGNLDKYSTFRTRSKQRLLSKTPAGAKNEAHIEKEKLQVVAELNKFLNSIGFDHKRLTKLQRKHLDNIRPLIMTDQLNRTDHALLLHEPPPYEMGSGTWVAYAPPYDGYFWSYNWEHSDEPDDPVLTRYLNQNNGRIGSSISTRLKGADNDDSLNAEYYTALKIWHQVPAAGKLEVYLAIRFAKSTYSGSIVDEFGLSDATLNQWAQPQLRILDPDGKWDIQTSSMFNILRTVHGGESKLWTTWDKEVSTPNDIHWYYFKTDRSFSAGSWLLLEAAIKNVTWFLSDDESITTLSDLDLHLDRVMVRSIIRENVFV